MSISYENFGRFLSVAISWDPYVDVSQRCKRVGADCFKPLIGTSDHLDKVSKFVAGTLDTYVHYAAESKSADIAAFYIKDCTKLLSDTLLFSQPLSWFVRTERDSTTGELMGPMICEVQWNKNRVQYASLVCYQLGNLFGFMRLLDSCGVGIFEEIGKGVAKLPLIGQYAARIGLFELKYAPVIAACVLGTFVTLYDINRANVEDINGRFVADKALKLISSITKGILVYYLMFHLPMDRWMAISGLLLGPANFIKYIVEEDLSETRPQGRQDVVPPTPAARRGAAVNLPVAIMV